HGQNRNASSTVPPHCLQRAIRTAYAPATSPTTFPLARLQAPRNPDLRHVAERDRVWQQLRDRPDLGQDPLPFRIRQTRHVAARGDEVDEFVHAEVLSPVFLQFLDLTE